MLADLVKYNYILFQLVKFDTEKQTAKEILVVSLAVFPTAISYQYGSRASINQTIGANEVEGFKESYGRALTKCMIRGTFGVKSRLSGTSYKSGWTRLIEFRELVYKLSHLQKGQSKRQIVGVNTAMYNNSLLGFLKDNEVIAVNYYDFHNNEKFAVNLDQFQINEDFAQNNLPSYVLTMTELGDIVQTLSSDVTLNMLQAAEQIMGGVIEYADALISKVSGNETIQAIGGALTYTDLAMQTLGAGLTGANSLLNVASTVKAVYGGKASALKGNLSSFKSIF